MDEALLVHRLWKARLFTFYPRLPIVGAVLLMPGVVFDGASLLYGDESGAVWWERLIGTGGVIICLALVAYHITLGALARTKGIHKSTNLSAADATYTVLQSKHTDVDNFESANSGAYTPSHQTEDMNGDVEMKVQIDAASDIGVAVVAPAPPGFTGGEGGFSDHSHPCIPNSPQLAEPELPTPKDGDIHSSGTLTQKVEGDDFDDSEQHIRYDCTADGKPAEEELRIDNHPSTLMNPSQQHQRR